MTANNLEALRLGYDSAMAQFKAIEEIFLDRSQELMRKIDDLRDEWKQDNAELIENFDQLGEGLRKAEAALRSAIITEYGQTGAKQVAPVLGLSVRINSKIVINDLPAATAWAKTNAPVCLILDEKALVGILKTLKDLPDFATLKETPSAVIGSLKAEVTND